MEVQNNIYYFLGGGSFKTKMTLDELAIIISKVLFGGLPFTYGERSVWEEIPSMYIDNSILGLFIVLGGYGGEEGYALSISTYGEFERYIHKNNLYDQLDRIWLTKHFYHLLKHSLKDYPEIIVLE